MGWVAVATAAFQAVSAVKGYSDQKKAASAQRRANEAATAQAAKEADIVRQDAARNAKKEAQDARRARSSQIAAYLKSGVSLEGSPLLVTDQTLAQGEENKQVVLENADARAESIILGGKAAQKPVQKADIFGTAAQIGGATKSGSKAAKEAGYI